MKRTSYTWKLFVCWQWEGFLARVAETGVHSQEAAHCNSEWKVSCELCTRGDAPARRLNCHGNFKGNNMWREKDFTRGEQSEADKCYWGGTRCTDSLCLAKLPLATLSSSSTRPSLWHDPKGQILVRWLIGQLIQHLPPSTPGHVWNLTGFLTHHTFQGLLLHLACPQQGSYKAGFTSISPPLSHLSNCILWPQQALGCAMFRTAPGSVLKSPFPSFHSSWVKSNLNTLTTAQLCFFFDVSLRTGWATQSNQISRISGD